ncbi:hypothetical protein F4561_003669 [Lipingzhangella halophila]|uniref:Uncharacterized protein n=1 Tax=Lipingzhangella halophila TaxID=1783352 RepID=A0A7W7W4H6_9ACTN|nr:hypothetical protein [Lipingzhangella halophila]MBB4932849.1 hypothetical protein [Lipingzhangella halophila]
MRRYLRTTYSDGVSPEGMQPDVPTRVIPGVQQPLAIAMFVRRAGLSGHSLRPPARRPTERPALVHSLPGPLQDAVVAAYQNALAPIYGYLVPVFLIGVIPAFFPPEKKLSETDTPAAGGRRRSGRNREGEAPAEAPPR